jgi:hypothetical protein
MSDFTVTSGRSSYYPKPGEGFGGTVGASTATFCLPKDLVSGLDANTLAIPGLPITVLTSSQIKIPETFFGMSVQNRVNDGLAGVTAKVTRSHDLKSGTAMWKYIEVADNVWNWTNIDAWVNTHYAAGRDMVFTLYGTPAWTSARPTELCAYGPSYLGVAAEPSDMTKWSRFCTQVATRYLGKIKYYEVWNEPNYNNDGTNLPTSPGNFYFSGTFATLADMMRLASAAIKAVDPTAQIISPPLTVWSATANQAAETWFTTFMATTTGATTPAALTDIVGVHLYLPSPNKVQDLAGIIDRINAAKTTAGISAVPTWDTESAPIGGDVSTLDNPTACALEARRLLTMAAKGIARSIYYQYDHGTMGFINRPAILEYRERIISILRGGRMTNAHRFTDGRVAYATESGLTII